jgi:methyl-accepting chemotaxis protein
MADGEMEALQVLMEDMGKVEGVLEIGLAAPSGVIEYASRAERLNAELDPTAFQAAAATQDIHEAAGEDSLLLVRAKRLEAPCIECHDQSQVGDLAGELYVRYSLDTLREAQAAGAARLEESHGQGLRIGVLTGLGGLLATSLGVYLLLGVQVCRPLDGLVEQMRHMAKGEADLTFRLPAESSDELGDVARAFNGFMENLQGLISEVLETSAAVADGSQEILAASRTMLDRASEQNERTQSAATAAEEMTATVTEVSRGAQEAADMAHSATETAEAGGKVVEAVVGGMRRVQERVENIAGKVRELGERSQAIGEVMQVIDDIADQTNLLALNAAIEAARAGEHGRGFAVVADEVRKLSEKTAQATRQVRDTVAAIQGETGAAITSVKQGLEEVGQSGELSRQAGESLREIVAKIAQNTEMVTQIATATEQQSVAVGDVSRGLETIAVLSGELVCGVEQTGNTAETLGGRTQRLRDLVARFKI